MNKNDVSRLLDEVIERRLQHCDEFHRACKLFNNGAYLWASKILSGLIAKDKMRDLCE